MYRVVIWDTNEVLDEFEILATAKKVARHQGHNGEAHGKWFGPIARVDGPMHDGSPGFGVEYNPRFKVGADDDFKPIPYVKAVVPGPRMGDDVWNEVMSKAVIMTKALERVENPLERLMVEGHLYEEDLGSFTPEMIELLTYEWIYLDVVGLEWLEMHGYLEALVQANADPKTMTEAESDAIWNSRFPDQAVEPEVCARALSRMQKGM